LPQPVSVIVYRRQFVPEEIRLFGIFDSVP
jgi:hypothetical protein